jgi:uncharacterized membrane protein YeaQ/YmgE (transglycosylase-associated protein family)
MFDFASPPASKSFMLSGAPGRFDRPSADSYRNPSCRKAPSEEAEIGSPKQGGTGMSFLAWIILGLVAGFIGSKIVNKTGEGVLLDIVLGIVGVLAGGMVFRFLGMSGGSESLEPCC